MCTGMIALRVRRDLALDVDRVDRQAGIDLHEHGNGSDGQRCGGGRDPRVRRHEHLVARSDARSDERTDRARWSRCSPPACARRPSPIATRPRTSSSPTCGWRGSERGRHAPAPAQRRRSPVAPSDNTSTSWRQSAEAAATGQASSDCGGSRRASTLPSLVLTPRHQGERPHGGQPRGAGDGQHGRTESSGGRRAVVKRQHVVLVAVTTVIAVVLAFAVGMLVGSSDDTDDTAAPPRTSDAPTSTAERAAGDRVAVHVRAGTERDGSAGHGSAGHTGDGGARRHCGRDAVGVRPVASSPAASAPRRRSSPLASPSSPSSPRRRTSTIASTGTGGCARTRGRSTSRPEGLTAQADHSEHGGAEGACGPPTETRTVELRVPDEQVYWCGPKGPESGHIMTATPFTGYGILTFSPKQSFTDISKVCWDQNLTFLDGRRWTNMLVVPEDVYQEHAPRLDYASPGFGPGFDVGADNLDTPESARTVKVFMGSVFWFPSHDGAEVANNGGVIFENDDRATRYTHCVEDLEDGNIRVTQKRPTATSSSTPGPATCRTARCASCSKTIATTPRPTTPRSPGTGTTSASPDPGSASAGTRFWARIVTESETVRAQRRNTPSSGRPYDAHSHDPTRPRLFPARQRRRRVDPGRRGGPGPPRRRSWDHVPRHRRCLRRRDQRDARRPGRRRSPARGHHRDQGRLPVPRADGDWSGGCEPSPRHRQPAARTGRDNGRTGGGGYAAQDFSPAHLDAAVDASLRRLRTDHIDLYQLHGPRDIDDRAAVERWAADIIRSGKVGRVGIGAEDLGQVTPWLARRDHVGAAAVRRARSAGRRRGHPHRAVGRA